MPDSRKALSKSEVATLLAVAIAMEKSDRPYVLQPEIAAIRQADSATLRRHFRKLEASGYLSRRVMPAEGRPQAYEILKTDEINAWLENYLKTESSKAPSQAYRTDVDKILQYLIEVAPTVIAWLRKEITSAF